jgi:hypothetical protein
MAKGRKPAISGLARPAGFWDDAAKATSKLAPAVAKRVESQLARTATKKRAMAKTSKMAKQHMDVMKKAGKNWSAGK